MKRKLPVKKSFKKKFTGNKKVRNAQKVEFNGIYFQSHLELFFYKYSKECGYEFLYESLKTILFEGLKLEGYLYQQDKTKNIVLDTRKLLNITYSPDFYRIQKNTSGEDVLIIVETKGLKTDSYVLKKKMFLKQMDKKWGQRFYFMEPRNQLNCKQVMEIIKTL
jgi:hypothetical protein